MKVNNGNVIVVAYNLKDQALVSWYLESKGDGKSDFYLEQTTL
ncbi:MAG: hypothetical protein ACR5KV_06155 [Wolbachia sp.]